MIGSGYPPLGNAGFQGGDGLEQRFGKTKVCAQKIETTHDPSR